MSINSKEIRLKHYPTGLPKPDDFGLETRELREVEAGELLVKNLWMSVDPYMRGRMIDRKSYVPPFKVGAVLEGGAVGKVLTSKHANFAEGDLVSSFFGWREAFISTGEGLTKIQAAGVPPEEFLGAVGLTGFTAYVGLNRIANLKDGETVFISAASGAVGSVACQIAKLKNCQVVGSVGSSEKANWLINDLNVDAVINYKKEANLVKHLPMPVRKELTCILKTWAAITWKPPWNRCAILDELPCVE